MICPGRRPGLARRAAWVPLVGLAVGIFSTLGATAGATPTTTPATPWVTGIGGSITIGIDQAPTGCNPNTSAGNTWANRLVLDPVLPGAFVINGNDQPVYDSAVINQAELQSTSPETVVYSINPKAVWSDGRPITAKDFIYTWQQERGLAGPISTATTAVVTAGATTPTSTTVPGATGTTGPAIGYRQIQSVKASNHGRTVTVVFSNPYADWQSLFDDLLPAHVLEKVGWSPKCTTIDPKVDLSGGPFEIASVNPGHEIVLARNPLWWEQAPNLDRIIIRIASGPTELSRWLATRKIDVSLPGGYDSQYLESVTSLPGDNSQSQASTTFLQLEFSITSPTTSPLDAREAIAHAIDRQDLVNQVVGWSDSSIVPSVSHIYAQSQNGYPNPKQPPVQVSGQPSYVAPATSTTPTATDPFPTTADLATTAKLLTGLGDIQTVGGTWDLSDNKPFTIRMAVNDGDPWAVQTSSLIVHQLEAAGFAVTVVDAASSSIAGADLALGTADVALLTMHASPFSSEAIGWYTPLLGPNGIDGSQDWSNFNDPTVDGLLIEASQKLNPVDASPIYAQADALLWQDMVALPLFDEPSVLAWTGTVAGVAPNANGPGLLWSPESWGIRVPPTSPITAAP